MQAKVNTALTFSFLLPRLAFYSQAGMSLRMWAAYSIPTLILYIHVQYLCISILFPPPEITLCIALSKYTIISTYM